MSDYIMPPHYYSQPPLPTAFLEPVPTILYRVPNQTWIERPAIQFHLADGRLGFPLSEAFHRNFAYLLGPDDPVFHPTTGTKVTFHIQWAQYEFFSKAKNVVTQRRSTVNSISRSKTAFEVAKVVKNFIDQNSTIVVGDQRWRVGPGFIELHDIYLLELRNVSVGSYQAILAVMRRP
ncbi:hypothetical protein EIP86_008074 [Pleurotus ostreatoroseus]|nr:hypothetical protein EIP86_008074 [Pleurotus ostreatoroseus]